MTRLDELLQMIAGAGDECVLWPYAKSKGYGRVFAAGETRRAHVVVCEFAHGAKPIGCEVAHSCGERCAVHARGTCVTCGSHTSKKAYLRCQPCAIEAQRAASTRGRQS